MLGEYCPLILIPQQFTHRFIQIFTNNLRHIELVSVSELVTI